MLFQTFLPPSLEIPKHTNGQIPPVRTVCVCVYVLFSFDLIFSTELLVFYPIFFCPSHTVTANPKDVWYVLNFLRNFLLLMDELVHVLHMIQAHITHGLKSPVPIKKTHLLILMYCIHQYNLRMVKHWS